MNTLFLVLVFDRDKIKNEVNKLAQHGIWQDMKILVTTLH